MECFAGFGGLAALGAGAKATFDYNRGNFLYDRNLRLKAEFALMDFRVEQAGQWREDVRDLISLTEYKMHVYLLVNVLMVGFTIVLWCEGRLPDSTPDWLMMGSALSITGAFMFLLLSIWMAMHAAIAAQGYEVRLLTQMVRLPIPTWEELEACRTNASDFEKLEPRQMFRVPFLMGRQERLAQPKRTTTSSTRVPRIGRYEAQDDCDRDRGLEEVSASDPWGLERPGSDIYELGTKEGSTVAWLRHIKLARQAMVYWQTYDAFARISMSIGVIELLLAISYYVIGYVLVQDGCRTAATYGVILLTVMAESIVSMDMSLPVFEARCVQLLLVFCPAMSCIAAYHWSNIITFRLHVAESFIVLAFLSHGCFLALMTRLCRITPQDNGTLLPVAFRSVLYLDVFGWLHGVNVDVDNGPSPNRWLRHSTSKRTILGRQSTSWLGGASSLRNLWRADTRGNRLATISERSLSYTADSGASDVSSSDAPDCDEELSGLRPATAAVQYGEDGSAIPQRPEDLAPPGLVQDFRDEVGAPNGSFAENSRVFFSAARWMPGEASHPAERCVCGNLFMDDSNFCRRCGKKRLLEEPVPELPGRTYEERYATGHESHNPGLLPWRVFSSVMMLTCLAWLFAGIYHILSISNLIAKEAPLIWESEPSSSDEPWERELPNAHDISASFLVKLKAVKTRSGKRPLAVRVPEHLHQISTSWPYPNVLPLSLSCDATGRHFVVTDRFRTFVATSPSTHGHGRGGRTSARGRIAALFGGMLGARRSSEGSVEASAHYNQELPSDWDQHLDAPPVARFNELDCPHLLGEGLLDAAVSCKDGKHDSAACRALVLHRHGRRMSACPLAPTPSGGVSHRLAGLASAGGLVANLSDSWLEVSRRESDSNRVSNSGKGPHARIEKIVALSVNAASCWGSDGTGQDNGCSDVAFAGTSRGRVVQLRRHSRRDAELVPEEILAEDIQGGSSTVSVLSSGAVRALGGGYLGILENQGKIIQVLDLHRGGASVGKITLPATKAATAFCVGGGHMFFIGKGSSPALMQVALPRGLMREI